MAKYTVTLSTPQSANQFDFNDRETAFNQAEKLLKHSAEAAEVTIDQT